jgi:DNA-binding transcriptional ArsR family regulator
MTFDSKIRSADGVETDPESVLFKALSNPLRYRILAILGEREASPKELSEFLKEGFHKTWEHVRRLENWGLIELVDTDHKNGGEQHFYRACTLPVLDAEEWDKIPRYVRQTNSFCILQGLNREIKDSVTGGHFDSHPNRVLIRKPLLLDEEGFKEVDAASIRHLREMEKAEAASAARRIKSGERALRVIGVSLAFPAAPSS